MASLHKDREPSAEGEGAVEVTKNEPLVQSSKPISTGVAGQVLTVEDAHTTTAQTSADAGGSIPETLLSPRPTRLRRDTKLSLAKIQDALEELRKEGFSEPQCTLKIIKQFKLVNLDNFTEKIACSFSNVTYAEIAPLFDLNPIEEAYDMQPLTLHRSRLPTEYILEILGIVRLSEAGYGDLSQHGNESTRVRYLDPLILKILSPFGKVIRNKPEQKLIGEDGAIEYQFVAFSSIIVLFIEVKQDNLIEKNLLKAIAQVMAESDACDVYNDNNDLWVPIRGILTDGVTLHFFEYRSDTRTWMKSAPSNGLSLGSDGTMFAIEVRRVSELLFDFLLMGYIDGLEAYYYRSTVQSRKPNSEGVRTQRKSTPRWEASLEEAKKALRLAREAHEMILGLSSNQKRSFDDALAENPKHGPELVISEANARAEDALKCLRNSVTSVPIVVRPFRDTGFSRLELEKGI